MMSTTLEADDVLRDYIKEASERICQCLKKDFAPFLQAMLPGILKSMKIEEEEVSNVPNPKGGDDDDEEDGEYITLSTGDGKLVKVSNVPNPKGGDDDDEEDG